MNINEIIFSTKVKTKQNMKPKPKKSCKSTNHKQVKRTHSFPRLMSLFKKRSKAKNIFVVTELCAEQNNSIQEKVIKNQLNVEENEPRNYVCDDYMSPAKPKCIETEQSENVKHFKSKIIHNHTPNK